MRGLRVSTLWLGAAAFLGWLPAPAAVAQLHPVRPTAACIAGRVNGTCAVPQPVGFKISRDLTLSFDHDLGVEEARRRVAARLETLRAQFADKIGSSTVTWNGDDAEVDVAALAQHAKGYVHVGDRDVQIKVHLPMLLAPLGGRVESFLAKTAGDTLKP
jgi:putative polyhydroxyalkanoate system protein